MKLKKIAILSTLILLIPLITFAQKSQRIEIALNSPNPYCRFTTVYITNTNNSLQQDQSVTFIGSQYPRRKTIVYTGHLPASILVRLSTGISLEGCSLLVQGQFPPIKDINGELSINIKKKFDQTAIFRQGNSTKYKQILQWVV